MAQQKGFGLQGQHRYTRIVIDETARVHPVIVGALSGFLRTIGRYSYWLHATERTTPSCWMELARDAYPQLTDTTNGRRTW